MQRVSPTALQRFLDCELGEFCGLPRPEGPELLKGKLRHRGMDLYESDFEISMGAAARTAALEPAFACLSDDDREQAVADLRKLPLHVVPARETVWAIEGKGLPEAMLFSRPGWDRPLATYDITPILGVWGQLDVLDQPLPGVLRVIDWKGAHPGEPEVQAEVYALFAFRAAELLQFPVTLVYFEAIGIPSGMTYRRVWEAEERPAIERRVLDLVRRYLAAKARPEHPATPGAWCRYCPAFLKPGHCRAGQNALTADPRDLVPATGLEALDDETLALVYEKADEQGKIVSSVRWSCQQELKRRVSAGAVVSSRGMVYKLRPKRSPKRTWDREETEAFLGRTLSVTPTEMPRYFEPDKDAIEARLKMRKDGIPGRTKPALEARRKLDQAYRDCFHQDVYQELIRAPIEGRPDPLPLDEGVTEDE